ncbi:MAG: A/G-specific adenine glycosylase [Chitinophagaceae bacterium]
MNSAFFTNQLMLWHRQSNTRKMPWKGEKDPYRIWLSEIILQQTRVEQGRDYYLRFIETFPTIKDLANAPESSVFKLWEGLGYYTRCRNLIETARFISFERNGLFPDTYNDIIALKGVGPYTAAAIASFAFGLPFAVVDGNVIRVLSRYFGILEPVDTAAIKKDLTERAQKLIPENDPAGFNQAIMDFGAVVCKPANPVCDQCPISKNCVAFKKGLADKIPFKSKRIIKRKRFLHYLIFRFNGSVYCKKRSEKDIWQNLYEFYLHESDQIISIEELQNELFFKKIMRGIPYSVLSVSAIRKQKLTHQDLEGVFYEFHLEKKPNTPDSFQEIEEKHVMQLAFPKFILSYLNEKSVYLNNQYPLFDPDKP